MSGYHVLEMAQRSARIWCGLRGTIFIALLRSTTEIHDTSCHKSPANAQLARCHLCINQVLTPWEILREFGGQTTGVRLPPKADRMGKRSKRDRQPYALCFLLICALLPAQPDQPHPSAVRLGTKQNNKEIWNAHPRAYPASGPVGRREQEGEVPGRSPKPPHLYDGGPQNFKIQLTPPHLCVG